MTDHRRPQPFWEEYHSDGAESDVTVVKSSSHSAAGQQGHALLLPGIPDQNYDGSARHGSGAMVKYKERYEDWGHGGSHHSVSGSSTSSHRSRSQGVHTPGSVNSHPNSGSQYNSDSARVNHSPPLPTELTQSFGYNTNSQSVATSDTTNRHRRRRQKSHADSSRDVANTDWPTRSNDNYEYHEPEATDGMIDRLKARLEPKYDQYSAVSYRSGAFATPPRPRPGEPILDTQLHTNPFKPQHWGKRAEGRRHYD